MQCTCSVVAVEAFELSVYLLGRWLIIHDFDGWSSRELTGDIFSELVYANGNAYCLVQVVPLPCKYCVFAMNRAEDRQFDVGFYWSLRKFIRSYRTCFSASAIALIGVLLP